MEFRIAHESDRRQVEGLWGYCFEPPGHPFYQWYFGRFWQPSNTLCGFEQRKLSACVHLNPYQLQIRSKTIPVSYIVGLATAPEARRGGIAGRLLLAALKEMRRRNHFFNILMPSKAGFYYPYGWELCYHQIKYRLELEELRSLAGREGHFELLASPEEWHPLATVYDRFTARRHGYAVRREGEWKRLLDSHQAEHGYITLLRLKGQPAGYMLYYVRDGVIVVGDMAFTDWQAQRSLLGFLYSHRSSVTAAEWSAPFDDLLHLALPNPKQGVSLVPFMAGRIVDVAGALRSIAYPQRERGCITLAVTDPLAEWNQGVFAVTVEDGRAKVQKTAATEAQVSLSIGALSLLLFGRLSAEELVRSDKMTVTDEISLEILDRWFPKQDNYINEYF